MALGRSYLLRILLLGWRVYLSRSVAGFVMALLGCGARQVLEIFLMRGRIVLGGEEGVKSLLSLQLVSLGQELFFILGLLL